MIYKSQENPFLLYKEVVHSIVLFDDMHGYIFPKWSTDD